MLLDEIVLLDGSTEFAVFVVSTFSSRCFRFFYSKNAAAQIHRPAMISQPPNCKILVL